MLENKTQQYQQLAQQIEAIVADEQNLVANMANISAILYWALENVNWIGFYLVKDQQLVLGPFHGQPACIRIPIGRGVCGTAVSEESIQVVKDVHQFSGHIACDANTNSEIVLPIYHNNKIIAVLDLDSPILSRFDEADKIGLSHVKRILEATIQDLDHLAGIS